MVLKRNLILSFLLGLILLISACQAETAQVITIPEKDQGPQSTPLPSPVPEKVLSICLGEEPRSLFLYGDQSTSARIIRQAIYDWVVIDPALGAVSALIEEIPSQENGLVSVSPVEVFPGDRIVDHLGNLTILANGIQYRPSGCFDPSCVETFEDQDSVTMDQVVVDFNIKDGISWSDGMYIGAADSVYSYQVAELIYGSGGPKKLRYSSAYQIGEGDQISWIGLPGYFGIYSYGDLFFDPLPEHLWKNLTRDELLTSTQSAERPLSWGLYQVADWVRGDHISLVSNDQNYSVSDGFPGFDALVFRFVDNAEEALAAFQSGECQLVANQPGLSEFQAELLQGAANGGLRIYQSENKAWEQLSFGINSRDANRTLLSDLDLRQALAGCINREKISSIRLDAEQIVDDFFSPGQSGLADQELQYTYQPVESGLALKELGWIDEDGNPETPRIANGVDGVANGTQLKFTLLAADVNPEPAAVTVIQEGLGACGVGLEVELLPAAELLSPGPDGPIFGRKFDLAYFAWAAGNYQPCMLFLTDQIPGLYPAYPKGWGGVNAPGYSNEVYDAACGEALTTLSDSDKYISSLEEIREIFREDLPVLALFFRREIIIADPELTGLGNDPYPVFWNIEDIQ
jgi:peptide/nickel transport system substrate-binding protein